MTALSPAREYLAGHSTLCRTVRDVSTTAPVSITLYSEGSKDMEATIPRACFLLRSSNFAGQVAAPWADCQVIRLWRTPRQTINSNNKTVAFAVFISVSSVSIRGKKAVAVAVAVSISVLSVFSVVEKSFAVVVAVTAVLPGARAKIAASQMTQDEGASEMAPGTIQCSIYETLLSIHYRCPWRCAGRWFVLRVH